MAKKILRLVSLILVVLSIFFLAYKFYQLKNLVQLGDFFSRHSLLIVVLVVIYGLNNFLLSCGWKNILDALDERINHPTAIQIFGISQIAKYVPGNVFQFAGKQILSLEYGLEAKKVIKSQFFEVIFLILSSLYFSLVVFMLNFLHISLYYSVGASLGLAVLGLAIARKAGTGYLFSLISYMLFMLISGGVFFTICSVLSAVPYDMAQAVYIISCFVAAWFLGFIMPGAPAGLGIRESVLIFLLIPVVHDQSVIFMAAIFTRIVTVGGDFIFFINALIFKRLTINAN